MEKEHEQRDLFHEVNEGYTILEAINEAKRCLHCKVPSCRKGCPISQDIPDWINEISKGNFGNAMKIINDKSNLPAVCGRVCPHEKQCEGHCVLTKKGQGIHVGKLERFIADFDGDMGLIREKLQPKTRGRVAVIGSGPAGLTIAGDLARMGFNVEVFEMEPEPGGVLMFGIPEYRLPKDVVDRETGAVAALGGKKADAAVTWLIDLMLGIPHIVLLILISFALGKGFWGVTIGVAVTHWPSLARVVRAEILQCKQSTFVAAARRLGQTPLRIAAKHMVPYVLPQFIVGLILLFPHAILHEAAVTFLGFGLPPEQPAIGMILSESMAYLSAGMWWLAVFPGLALIATVLLFDLAGSSPRKLVDPHSAQE